MNGLDYFSTFPTTTPSNSGDAEDDDWGDFVNSPDVLPRSASLPAASLSVASKRLYPIGFFADRDIMDLPELTHPDSAPNRIESPWVKPRGLVPLSVFGEAGEDGGDGSGLADSSLKFSFFSSYDRNNKENGCVNKGSNANPSVGINDLIANLYRQTELSESAKCSETFSKDESRHSDLNGKSWVSSSWNLSGNLSSSRANGIHVNGNGLDLELSEPELSKNCSDSVLSIEKLSWNALDLDTQRLDSERNVVIPSASRVNLDSNGLNSDTVNHNNGISRANLDSIGLNLGFVDQNNGIDEDAGWEFKNAESKIHSGDENSMNDEKKTENGLPLGSNILNLSWNFLNSGSNGIIPNINHPIEDAVKSTSKLGDADEELWDDGWEFKGAESQVPKGDATNMVEGKYSEDVKGGEFAFGFKNGMFQNSDLFSASSQQSSGWDFGFDFNSSSTTQNGTVSYPVSQSQQDEGGKDSSVFPADGKSVSEENSWAFKDSFSVTGAKHEKKEPELEKPKGPLPLSLFGDGEIEIDDSEVLDDISTSTPASSRAQNRMPGPTISISDLISSLYGQAAEKNSVSLTEKPSENGFGSKPVVSNFNLVNGDDDSWEFKDPTQNVMFSNLTKGDDDYYDDIWEFKSAFLGNETESKSCVPAIEDQDEKPNTKLELNDYSDFYTKLKIELCYTLLNHLDNLKKACGSVVDSGKGFEVKALDEEIKDLHNQLHEDIMVGGGVNLENLQPKCTCIDEFIQALQEPKFQALESEYNLSKKLLSAEKDWKSSIELVKHAELILKILALGSAGEQSKHISTWSRIVSVCARELEHGASIWKQAFEKSVHDEILSKPQGKEYFLALGEIYRAVEILNASIRLYKPWMLLNPATNLLALLSQCTTLWSNSGLEVAVQSITSSSSESDYNESASALLESIEYISKLDALVLYNNVVSAEEPACQISGLPARVVPGMKMVMWNGKHYFVTLANLWANLICLHPPSGTTNKFP